ncbi:M15 family metallopeptidase [Deinococcus roseus]|uniref:Peptidase M15C domain-containing protein n=1 Tax=Deinococcus roseus TaxID=392414 RepID=A0ABQ2CZ64_9DEIO|nr:M15 family metallopeptidase [Deinococcus roseus]GGJ35461.1 hypothetical protein GCM10008938_21920 [Deinococcus roseus]
MLFLQASSTLSSNPFVQQYQQASPATVDRLVQAYPDALLKHDQQKLYFQDGQVLQLRTRKTIQTYPTLLDDADVLDQMALPYPACQPITAPAYLQDPGRARSETLFKALYGETASKVQKQLQKVNWFGSTVLFHPAHGAKAALEQVEQHLQKHPEWLKYLQPNAGTFYWRTVAGTKHLSMHSFGISIDLNTRYADYWKWKGHQEGQKNIPYHNQLPEGLVFAFERQGFVWGGRWYHFDTMHFEYRPELISSQACQQGQ